MNAEQMKKVVEDANKAAVDGGTPAVHIPEVAAALIIANSNDALVQVSKRNADVIAKALTFISSSLDSLSL